MPSEKVNFAQLKKDASIEFIAQALGLELTHEDDYYKGACPACEGSGDRDLSIRPSWGTFKCFASERFGSVIDLVMHTRKCSLPQAGAYIRDAILYKPARAEEAPRVVAEVQPEPPTQTEAATGFPPKVCKAVGITFAKKVDMEDCVKVIWKKPARVPIRTEMGHLLGYIVIEGALLPKEWRLP